MGRLRVVRVDRERTSPLLRKKLIYPLITESTIDTKGTIAIGTVGHGTRISRVKMSMIRAEK